MRKIRYLLMVCAAGLVGLLSMVNLAHAETHITDGYIYLNTIWSSEASPYIVDDPVTIPPDVSLTVDPGVSIVGSENLNGYNMFYVNGSLTLNGQAKKKISISGSGGMDVFKGSLNISHSDISSPNGIGLSDALATISNSSLSGSETAVTSYSSDINISDSLIHGNKKGIYVASSEPPVIIQVRNNDPQNGRGGIGNALADAEPAESPRLSKVNIVRSSITTNSEGAIINDDISEVSAVENWWGDSAGPVVFGDNKIAGKVRYSPWLESDPFASTSPKKCCSSVLFIPGLEGTRLYMPDGTAGGNRLWEPNRNADVKKLYLDTSGSSTVASIYSGEPIDKALGLKGVYGKFMDFMQVLVQQGTINEWKAFGYDWRMPIEEVVAGVQKGATTTESLVRSVEDIAARSQTGKVAIIAHSNGGLVAKQLIKTLAEYGKESLVDSLVSVAVPYIGTPQAIAGLLHGDSQSIARGIILSAKNARDLGSNMASAYSLLPSRQYFFSVFAPTVAFASTTVKGVNPGVYPKALSTFDQQSDFISNTNRKRLNSSSSDTSLPIKGNDLLLAKADALHVSLDDFAWPSNIARFAIVGWNAITTKALEYFEKRSCHGTIVGFTCEKVPAHTASSTRMGDGTVVAPSAAYDVGDIVSLDLEGESRLTGSEIRHANILESSTTEAAIAKIITRNRVSNGSKISDELSDELSGLPNVTLGAPDYSKGEPSFLLVTTHSPVDLHIYDSKGRHTGVVPKPEGLDVEDGLYTFTEENIPGSKLTNIGGTDDSPEYQAYLPDKGGEKYSIVLEGTDVGQFTLDIDRVRHGSYAEKVEFADLPITPLAVASTSLVALSDAGSSVWPSLSSTTLAIRIDADGDGAADIIAKPGQSFDPILHLEMLKKTVTSLSSATLRGKELLRRIDRLESLVRKGKVQQAEKAVQKISKRVGHVKAKKLSEANRKNILDMIDIFIAQYE